MGRYWYCGGILIAGCHREALPRQRRLRDCPIPVDGGVVISLYDGDRVLALCQHNDGVVITDADIVPRFDAVKRGVGGACPSGAEDGIAQFGGKSVAAVPVAEAR